MNKLMNTSLFKVIRRETSRIAGSWVLVFTTMIAPVAAFLVIMWLFSDGVVRDLPVAVVDMDHTAFSSRVTRMIDATPVCNVMCRLNSTDEARQMMDDGKIDSIVVLPQDLERKVMNNSTDRKSTRLNSSHAN